MMSQWALEAKTVTFAKGCKRPATMWQMWPLANTQQRLQAEIEEEEEEEKNTPFSLQLSLPTSPPLLTLSALSDTAFPLPFSPPSSLNTCSEETRRRRTEEATRQEGERAEKVRREPEQMGGRKERVALQRSRANHPVWMNQRLWYQRSAGGVGGATPRCGNADKTAGGAPKARQS